MSLADDLDALSVPKTTACQVCYLLSDSSPLEPENRSRFAAALAAGAGGDTLSKVLRKAGYILPKQHVYDHRKQEHGA